MLRFGTARPHPLSIHLSTYLVLLNLEGLESELRRLRDLYPDEDCLADDDSPPNSAIPDAVTRLALADRLVEEGEARVARQRALVDRLDEAGRDTAAATGRLASMRHSLAIMRAYRAAMRRALPDAAEPA